MNLTYQLGLCLYVGLMFNAFEFCYAVQHNKRYTLLFENQSLFCTTAGVLSTFLSFIFLHMPQFVPSFLNLTVLHYNALKKALLNQTSIWILVG
jgi:hypothetical protein